MIIYIIQTILFQALFLFAYDTFLQKETFFKWNRIYLLATPLISFIIPLVKFTAIEKSIYTTYTHVLPEVIINTQKVIDKNISANFSTIINLLFSAGVLLFLAFFIFKLLKIMQLISKNTTKKHHDYTLVLLNNSKKAFSFFNYIFLGKELHKAKEMKIIQHELVHSKHYHTADLLFFEILKILMWFNPFIYLYQNRIKALHEFIADEEVLKNTNKTEYFNLLLATIFETKNTTFINPFYNHSLIKKRIIMSTKRKSKKVNRCKYLILLPLMASMLFYTSCNHKEKKPKKLTEKTKKDNTVTEKMIKKGVPFALVTEVPVFPGCEESGEESKKCFSKKIQQYVAKNFNSKIAEDLNISSGTKRIAVLFKIDSNGNVVDAKARAPHKLLEKEALRVITSLPKMIPGKYNNKPVTVTYSLPIAFKIE